MILTVDFGTSVTKVALWGDEGLVALVRAEVATSRPEPGLAEQDPFSWWTSVVVGCAGARAQAPAEFGAVTVVACSGARQTFVPVTAGGEPLGKGLLWSDRRAVAEAAALAASLGGSAEVAALTGVPLDAEGMAAKVAWLAAHEPARLAASDWLLGPRDLVVWRLTGEVVTDLTMASRTGLYDVDGQPVALLAGPAATRLPPVVPPGSVPGGLRAVPAAELGLRPGTPVVVAGGDRACEVLGAGASPARPLASWGTTANVSAPVGAPPRPVPDGLVVSRGAEGGWLLEGGLSAAGSLLEWLGRLSGTAPEALARLAADRPPGARGVVVLPWLDGARAPWWRDGARGAVVGLSSAHDAGDLARAVFEGVAYDLRRCLAAMEPCAGPAEELALGGAGTTIPAWSQVLTAVTGLPAAGRRSGEAASAGAALLGARATGDLRTLDDLDPPAQRVEPDPAATERYRELWDRAEQTAATVVEL